jgi:GMP synthase (glutamine-hydrolysing)
MTRVAVVQHETDCPPAMFGDWLVEAGADVAVCRPYAGDDLPDPATYDALVVLGGSMGAHDDADHLWLGAVKERIREHAADGTPVLGICLGHQLSAAALGGRSGRNPNGQQFGLIPLGWTPDAHLDPLMSTVATPRRGVQWNDDVVTEEPAGTVTLARCPTGELQAARFAPTVWGVQLHPEVTAQILAPWAAHDREVHLAAGLDPDAVLAEIDGALAELVASWRPLAQRFVEVAAHAASSRR